MKNIIYKKSNHIGTVTISRPEVKNALNDETLFELEIMIDEIEKDDDVYCVIITGAGEKAFVAGADIVDLRDLNIFAAEKKSLMGHQIYRKLELLPKPVIAAVNGYALGGGCELAMSCDIRIASENAVFGLPEVGLGITPGWGGTQRLARLVGAGMAKQMIFTGDAIKADEAFRIGLVCRVVPQTELMQTATALAERIIKNAPIAVRNCKAAINRGLNCDIDTAICYEASMFAQCFASEDQTDAMTAFLEKRKVEQFKNR